MIFVNEGYPFNFSCGPSNDPLEMISVTLNNNEPSTGIVNRLSGSIGDKVLYQYRVTNRSDDDTTITCTAGQDTGRITVTVFRKLSSKIHTTIFTLYTCRWSDG